MGAGAYAFDINPLGDSVNPNVQVRRMLPLPPAQNSGVIKYGRVFVSLSAPVEVPVDVTIVNPNGNVMLAQVKARPGRTGLGREIQPGDQALDISFLTTNTAKIVTAFVEFATP